MLYGALNFIEKILATLVWFVMQHGLRLIKIMFLKTYEKTNTLNLITFEDKLWELWLVFYRNDRSIFLSHTFASCLKNASRYCNIKSSFKLSNPYPATVAISNALNRVLPIKAPLLILDEYSYLEKEEQVNFFKRLPLAEHFSHVAMSDFKTS